MYNFTYEESVFTKDECESILTCHDGFKTIDECDFKLAAENIRSSKYGKVSNIKLLEKIILPKIKKYNIKSIESGAMFIEYGSGDYFDKHRDVAYTDNIENKRVCSVIIQLSDESEYVGGELIVEGKTSSKKIGTIIVFKSTDIHEVTKITSGNRKVFIFMPVAKDIVKTKMTII
jgi:predicted 2-oxoglutarate/Fe(II)-dependent dioxygenase YbiX